MKFSNMILFPKPLSTGITVLIWEPPQPASFSSFELNVLAVASYDLKSSASVLGSQVPPTVEAFLRLATRSGCITWPLASHPPHPQRKQCVFLPAWWTCAFISASLPHRGRQRHWFAMWKTTRRNKSHHLPKEFSSGIAYLAISSTTKANIVEHLGKRLLWDAHEISPQARTLLLFGKALEMLGTGAELEGIGVGSCLGGCSDVPWSCLISCYLVHQCFELRCSALPLLPRWDSAL